MIGGIDVEIPTRGSDSAVEVAVRAIRQLWPRSVFENGTTGDPYHRFEQVPFGEITELFVYRDQASAEAWDAEGAIPSLNNTMVHIIADRDLITIVIDDSTDAMKEIVGVVESALSDDILYIPAEAA